jgi:hypothetical protein
MGRKKGRKGGRERRKKKVMTKEALRRGLCAGHKACRSFVSH